MSTRPRLLFLDFDGVLHPYDSHFELPDVAVPLEQLLAAGLFVHRELLEQILAPFPHASLVVHSSWRKTHGVPALRALLGPLGHRLIAATIAGLDRELSVLEFMRRRQVDADQVLILDDQPDTFVKLRPRVVACDPMRGISDVGVQQVLDAALRCQVP